MLSILLENLGLIIFVALGAIAILGIILTSYYDGFSDEPVKIKYKSLRLSNYYDKFVIEKFYFPGIWLRIINKPFVVPTYVTEITEDMTNIYNSKGEIISRTTVFPNTDDYELAKQEFARIEAYTARDKYRRYVLKKPVTKKAKEVSQNEKPVETSELSKKIKRKNTK